MRPPVQFARSVTTHWGSLLTGGVLIALLGLWQNTGHPVSHWVYWSIAVVGLLVASYRAWLDEHRKAVGLAARLEEATRKQDHESAKQLQDQKRDLAKVLTVLRAVQQEAVLWLDITLNKWGMPPATVNLVPDDWATVVYVSGSVSAEFRRQVESLGEHLSEANSLIFQFLSMLPNYRDVKIINRAHDQLSQGVPTLAEVISRFKSFENTLG